MLQKTGGQTRELILVTVNDYILWYAKNHEHVKYRQLLSRKASGERRIERYTLVVNYERRQAI